MEMLRSSTCEREGSMRDDEMHEATWLDVIAGAFLILVWPLLYILAFMQHGCPWGGGA